MTTGALTIKAGAAGCFTEAITPSCTDSVGLLADGYELALSPTGSHLYVPNVHGVAVFTRGAGGTLTQAAGTAGGCLTNDGASTVLGECESLGASGPALDQARAVTSAPSGKYVFVAGTHGSVVFARNASTGRLTMTDCVEGQAGTIPGCQSVDGANGFGVELSPDGTRAIVGGEDVAGFGVYDFDETTGHLTQLPSPEGCFSGSGAFGCTPVPGGFIGKSVWGPDGRNAYVLPDGNLLNLLQDHPPVCQSASVTVPMNAAAAIPLACTDANGEAITIQVSAPSQGGTLGAVDQATDTVVYTAKAGFSGADSFTVTATAGGRTSAPATVTVTVPPPPVPPVPPGRPVGLADDQGRQDQAQRQGQGEGRADVSRHRGERPLHRQPEGQDAQQGPRRRQEEGGRPRQCDVQRQGRHHQEGRRQALRQEPEAGEAGRRRPQAAVGRQGQGRRSATGRRPRRRRH